MPKSKEILSSEDDLSSSEEAKPTKKKVKVEKKEKVVVEEKVPAKSAKNGKRKAKDETDEEAGDSDSNDRPESDGMYMLAKNRFVSVSSFKGKAYVNIREYYEKDGKSLPGKKGISLPAEQWNNLKKFMDKIDADLKKN